MQPYAWKGVRLMYGERWSNSQSPGLFGLNFPTIPLFQDSVRLFPLIRSEIHHHLFQGFPVNMDRLRVFLCSHGVDFVSDEVLEQGLDNVIDAVGLLDGFWLNSPDCTGAFQALRLS